MNTVIRQEWKSRTKDIVILIIALAIVNIGSIVCNGIDLCSRTNFSNTVSKIWSVFAFVFDFFGVTILLLIRGSGNIKPVLFGDTAYLMMTLPKDPFVLVAGKLIVSLIEFIIYMAQSVIYFVVIVAQLGGDTSGLELSMEGEVVVQTCNVTFLGRLKYLFEHIISEHIYDCLQLVVFVIIMYVALQITLNLAFTVFAAFFRGKKIPKLLSSIVLVLVFWLTIKLISLSFDAIDIENIHAVSQLWATFGVVSAIAAIYYVVTCLLIKFKIEI